MTYEEADRILQTYSLEELIYSVDGDPNEALCFLVNERFIELPEILPTW